MMRLMISAAHGPAECQRGAAHVLQAMLAEAKGDGITARCEARQDSEYGIHSALVALQGSGAAAFCQRWQGTVQWIWQSTFRPKHPRKNWFIGVFAVESSQTLATGEVRMQTCKASGKGGQHVNKTRSAVRLIDDANGLTVKIQSERSQHRNRTLALAVLAEKQALLDAQISREWQGAQRLRHWQVERGNPVRIFVGERFQERKR